MILPRLHLTACAAFISTIASVIAVLACGAASLAAADAAWIEGEAPTAMPAFGSVESAEHPAMLSGKKWLKISVGAGEVEAKVPGDGIPVSYHFDLAADGPREVWARVGFEAIRAPFRCRIDGGAWATIAPTDLTTDLVELSRWCEAGWIKVADATLKAGPHALDIEVLKKKDGKGKYGNLGGLRPRLRCASPIRASSPTTASRQARSGRPTSIAPPAPGLPPCRSRPPASAARATLPLSGTWEICRDDEPMPLADPATAIAALPAHPCWRGVRVPGDKNTLRPELEFAHRFWYRTRVDVPASRAGQSFRMVFPSNNLNTTVWVNGVACGFDKNPLARAEIDITKAMKPGRNELWVGMRDAWYGRSWDPGNPMLLRGTFNTPVDYFSQGFQNLAYPISGLPQSGMLVTPLLIAAGPVYTDDAFTMASVAKHQLTVELTEPRSRRRRPGGLGAVRGGR